MAASQMKSKISAVEPFVFANNLLLSPVFPHVPDDCYQVISISLLTLPPHAVFDVVVDNKIQLVV